MQIIWGRKSTKAREAARKGRGRGRVVRDEVRATAGDPNTQSLRGHD